MFVCCLLRLLLIVYPCLKVFRVAHKFTLYSLFASTLFRLMVTMDGFFYIKQCAYVFFSYLNFCFLLCFHYAQLHIIALYACTHTTLLYSRTLWILYYLHFTFALFMRYIKRSIINIHLKGKKRHKSESLVLLKYRAFIHVKCLHFFFFIG